MAISKPQTKSAKLIAMLNRAKGESIDEICQAMDWKPHSVRAFLSALQSHSHNCFCQLTTKHIHYQRLAKHEICRLFYSGIDQPMGACCIHKKLRTAGEGYYVTYGRH